VHRVPKSGPTDGDNLLLVYSAERNSENRSGSDKVIAISWVVQFFGTQCSLSFIAAVKTTF